MLLETNYIGNLLFCNESKLHTSYPDPSKLILDIVLSIKISNCVSFTLQMHLFKLICIVITKSTFYLDNWLQITSNYYFLWICRIVGLSFQKITYA